MYKIEDKVEHKIHDAITLTLQLCSTAPKKQPKYGCKLDYFQLQSGVHWQGDCIMAANRIPQYHLEQ